MYKICLVRNYDMIMIPNPFYFGIVRYEQLLDDYLLVDDDDKLRRNS